MYKVGTLTVMLVLVTTSFRLAPGLLTKQNTLQSTLVATAQSTPVVTAQSTPVATTAHDNRSATYQKVLELNGKAADAVTERLRRKIAELDKRGVTGDERRKQLTAEAKAAGQDMRRAFQENNNLLPSHQPHAPTAP